MKGKWVVALLLLTGCSYSKLSLTSSTCFPVPEHPKEWLCSQTYAIKPNCKFLHMIDKGTEISVAYDCDENGAK